MILSKSNRHSLSFLFILVIAAAALGQMLAGDTTAEIRDRPNIVLILVDDLRYDAIGHVNDRLETPHIDEIARNGAIFRNAFVTTSLCSPSRATILTGLYAHAHGIVDNNVQNLEPGVTFFPQHLKTSGYTTAFIGKWHMGHHTDEQQPGFDHWLSFAGQGSYWPHKPKIDGGKASTYNIDGTRVPQRGYITDELTDYALDWLEQLDGDEPFFLYLSHKAVHAPFLPAARHKEQYRDLELELPHFDEDDGKPRWVRDQRNSWHGVEFPYHTSVDLRSMQTNYYRSLSAVDDSVGRIVAWLRLNEALNNTFLVFMGDNGFMFGEHGLIDKRNAYEPSIRIPIIAMYPDRIPAGTTIDEVVANIDIAPTVLAAAGVVNVPKMHGLDFLQLAQPATDRAWRDSLFYEYFWEWTFPHTPTTFAIREGGYKLIQYHGVWDTDELYHLERDPGERNNLIDEPVHRARVRELRRKLFDILRATGGDAVVPFTRKEGMGLRFRNLDKEGQNAARFPRSFLKKPDQPDREDYKE